MHNVTFGHFSRAQICIIQCPTSFKLGLSFIVIDPRTLLDHYGRETVTYSNLH